MARLEHVNICVPDPDATAQVLCDLFDWSVRWSGPALESGRSVHVGNADSYLALYAPRRDLAPEAARYAHVAGLNHIGVVVDDIDDAEARVKAAGYTTFNHADYEPGRRFYFDGPDGVEYELVQYD